MKKTDMELNCPDTPCKNLNWNNTSVQVYVVGKALRQAERCPGLR